MFDTIAGLPLHVLVVHATEVIVPAAALAVLLAALWPRFRRWATYAPAALAVAGLVLVPLSTESGEALEGRVGESELVEVHAHLADGLLPWAAGLALVALALLWWSRREVRRDAGTAPRWIAAALVAAALTTATGTAVEAVRVGHSGAAAVWSATVQSTSPAPGDDDD
ncbi:DUF2231 domain-containing protein [uncultured Cellulomonas sp.]|uniref:DUF2231 domain-containing protein n=1 Tax=uncultured Cellulomonas sp. TaxID=189682 RepID=UPI002637D4E9|nr:DUF2231 domain-containing protein [uncultured Cellulomonas sp.]